MKVKGTKDLQAEAKVFHEYSDYVGDRTSELGEEIAAGKARIEQLEATIGTSETDIKSLGTKIAKADEDTVAMEADRDGAASTRAAERAKFLEAQTDYAESLYALDHAIQTLKAQSYDRPQALLFLQNQARGKAAAGSMRRVLAALELPAAGAPAVAGYEFQSSSIVDLLAQLKDKFRAELADMEKGEMNAAHAHEMASVHLGSVLSELKDERQALAAASALAAEALAAAKGELVTSQADLAAAERFLKDLTATFAAKNSTFEENQKVRQEELAALTKAVEILSQPNVAGAYAKHVNLAQSSKSPSFLQLRSQSSGGVRAQLAELLATRAKTAGGSRALMSLAAQLQEATPFDKVIGLVEDLLARLKEEAAAEADHKQFCDAELHKNKLKRDQLGPAAAKLAADIEQKGLEAEAMGERIAKLAAEQAELQEALSKATATRSEEKALNLAAITDSQAGQTAVKDAIVVLREFYAKQGAALVQQVPEMAAYSGMQGKEGGVLGMLAVIESDFARVKADTKAAESQATLAYEQYAEDTTAALKAKHDEEYKLSLDKDQAEFEKSQLQKDLTSTQKQLDLANSYYEELKPQCIKVHVSFEERVAKREEEVAALKEAYKILDARG